jgi:hypothetical protein
MHLALLVLTALVAHLAVGTFWARIPHWSG